MSSDLENRTRYEPSEAEPRVFERWEASGRFHPEPDGSPEENFSIAIPPPNVTGALHMGHALNGSIQDALIRHARMQGRNTKWILGTDHAGIATQTQVERFLREQGTSREELGREEFVRRTWEWREQYGGTILNQYRNHDKTRHGNALSVEAGRSAAGRPSCHSGRQELAAGVSAYRELQPGRGRRRHRTRGVFELCQRRRGSRRASRPDRQPPYRSYGAKTETSICSPVSQSMPPLRNKNQKET